MQRPGGRSSLGCSKNSNEAVVAGEHKRVVGDEIREVKENRR